MNVPPPPLPAFPLSAFTSLSAITRLYLADLATMQLITSKLKSRQRTFSLANKFAGRQPGSFPFFCAHCAADRERMAERLLAKHRQTDRQGRISSKRKCFLPSRSLSIGRFGREIERENEEDGELGEGARKRTISLLFSQFANNNHLHSLACCFNCLHQTEHCYALRRSFPHSAHRPLRAN